MEIKQRISKKHPKALGVRVLIRIATLSYPSFIAFLIRHCSLAIQGRSLLVAQALFNSGSLDTTTIVDKLDVHLKIAFNVEGLRCQGHQELSKDFGALVTPSMIAPILGLGKTFSLGLYLREGLFQLVLASFFFFNFSERCLYLDTTSSNLGRSVSRSSVCPVGGRQSPQGCGSTSPRLKRTASTLPSSALEQKPEENPTHSAKEGQI
ncbi:hypothetical protein Cgig2_001638 [Carnegiea gigantea]|uniref:Uncharacterized protein n=1 Tax=Carnegiea gigantea TaxID=171969 RepID=A0A9Q1GYM0_9CARY|nr:hypothetical protein Cgig2_001638 [Carnegiea gigantea]